MFLDYPACYTRMATRAALRLGLRPTNLLATGLQVYYSTDLQKVLNPAHGSGRITFKSSLQTPTLSRFLIPPTEVDGYLKS